MRVANPLRVLHTVPTEFFFGEGQLTQTVYSGPFENVFLKKRRAKEKNVFMTNDSIFFRTMDLRSI